MMGGSSTEESVSPTPRVEQTGDVTARSLQSLLQVRKPGVELEWPRHSVGEVLASPFRIEVTRGGRFNPLCKEASRHRKGVRNRFPMGARAGGTAG